MDFVLYEDNHMLVLNKPAGLLTQPNDLDTPSLEELGKAWLKEKYQKPGNVFLHALHRLDKPVSGIVVFAKTSKALTRLNASMRGKETKKMYLAWVEGSLPKESDCLKNYLLHDSFCAKVVRKTDPDAKEAILHYTVLGKKEGNSLVEIELETGRYHQIRVQMMEAGYPIIGDQKYGSRRPFFIDAIALIHKRFSIPHPITHENLIFEAPFPSYFPLLT